jgi:hypothetical protein
MLRIVLLVFAMGLLGPGTSYANTKVLRFSRNTSLPPSWQRLPELIPTSIAAATDAKPSTESLVTLECDGSDACLVDVAKQLEATELIFGTIRSGDDASTKLVTITRFAPDGRRAESTFTIVLVDAGAPRALVREALPFLQKPLRDESIRRADRDPEGNEPDDSDTREDNQARDDREDKRDRRDKRDNRSSFDRDDRDDNRDRDPTDQWGTPTKRGSISGTTYGVLAGGGVGIALGLGFTLHAWSLRGDVARAPVETSADLRRLAMLEQRGQMFTTAGAALIAVGGAVVVYGVVRVWRDRSERQPIDRSLALVPTTDGAAIVFGGSWK